MLTNIMPFFRYSPALRAIQKDDLNIAIVQPDLTFEAVLLGLPDVTESTKSSSGFVKTDLDVSIVTAYEASEVCEIFNTLQCLPIDGCWRYC